VLALALFVVLGAALLWAPSAEAQTQTSGSILLGPDCCQISHSPAQGGDNVGHPNDTVHIAVRIQSTSQIGGVFADATVVGTTKVILGCAGGGTTETCSGTELGALTFDSCAVESGVTACAQDPGNSNHVLITYPSGGKSASTVPGGTLVATITAHFTAGQEILAGSTTNGHVAAEGQFFLLGSTGDGNLRTSAAAGSAGGSAPAFYPGFCGDGIVNAAAGETCDPNDTTTSAGCRTSGPFACTRCGDGVVQSGAGETCDGTAGTVGSGCRAAGTTDGCTSCGDGVMQASSGETCDGTAGSVGSGCRADCTSCGDGVLQAAHSETCDGTAGTVGSGCRADCTSCGDGVLQAGHNETCDGTAGTVGTGCRADCTSCGDGVLQAGHNETCDGTAGSVGSGCRADCTSCGDGVLQAGHNETCDGTAGSVGSGCRADCTSCGDGVLQASAGETCDGTAGTVGTGCRSDCTACGDGIIQAADGEQCDDGNTAGGDGCSATCQTEVACDLTVEKACEVPTPPYVCTKPITSLTMKWDGTVNPPTNCIRIAGTAGVTPFDIDGICPGDVVTVSGYDGSQGNDVFWNIHQAGTTGTGGFIGQSSFHLSCSDVDMNSADDCGKIEGNNKGSTNCLPGNTNASCINQWIFEGMTGPVGSPPSASLVCPDVSGGATDCSISPTPFVCSGAKPLQSLTMQWDGAQAIRITGIAGVTPFDIDNIQPGDVVTVTGYNGSQGNDVFWNIFAAGTSTKIGQSSFHLSCSDVDMNGPEDCGKAAGDNKGSTTCSPAPCVNTWIFEGMAGQGKVLDCTNPNGFAPVTYKYTVTNNTSTAVTGLDLNDAVTDSGGTTIVHIAGPFDLGPNESMSFQAIGNIGEDTTDIATASNGTCSEDSNQVTVTVAGGGSAQCAVAATSLTIKDRDVKWNLKAPKGVKLEIKTISISWPLGTNGPLQEIHLDAPRIFHGSLGISPATISAFSGSAKDRSIDGGQTDTLRFKFQHNAAQGPYDITVEFTNGCSVHIAKP
jgi:cysteine-rich repeat protein